MARSDDDITARDRDRRELRAMGLTTRAVNVLAQAGARTGADLLAPDLRERLSRIHYCPAYVLDEIACVGEMLAFDPVSILGGSAARDRRPDRRGSC